MMRTRALIAAMAALCLPSCTVEVASLDDSPVEDVELAAVLDDAAGTWGVPLDLLKAVSYVETRWQIVDGDDELGREAAAGVMGLWGENLARGAAAAGYDSATVRTSTRANVAAAAARLAELAAERGVAGGDLAGWAPVLADFAQIADDEARAAYAADVMRVLAGGASRVAEDGRVIVSLDPHAEIGMPADATAAVATTDFAGAIWRPSPNFSARSSAVTLVVIHSCEGGYAGCWGWLRNSSAGASAHYVVNESGSEVTQLVRESARAWHVSANYECSRAGGQQCSRNGTSVNNFAVGIEHAGFGKQTSWASGLIETSAKLTCDITRRHNIPRDRNHIVSHGQLQPWNRTDPGPNWPWSHYLDRVRAHCGSTGTSTGGSQPTPPAAIIVDSNNANNDPAVAKIELSGTWTASTSTAGYYGSGYWTAPTQEASAPATFWFYLPSAGTRTIDAWWTTGTNRATAAPFIAFDASGNELGRRVVNQQQNGSEWVTLGTWTFTAGWNQVVLSRWATPGQFVIADAIRVR